MLMCGLKQIQKDILSIYGSCRQKIWKFGLTIKVYLRVMRGFGMCGQMREQVKGIDFVKMKFYTLKPRFLLTV